PGGAGGRRDHPRPGRVAGRRRGDRLQLTVLGYYAIANASAQTLSAEERRWPRPLAALGLAGCLVVASSLPTSTILGGVIVLGAGLAAYVLRPALGYNGDR